MISIIVIQSVYKGKICNRIIPKAEVLNHNKTRLIIRDIDVMNGTKMIQEYEERKEEERKKGMKKEGEKKKKEKIIKRKREI